MTRLIVPDWIAAALGSTDVRLAWLREGRSLRAFYRADTTGVMVRVSPTASGSWSVTARRTAGDRSLVAETTDVSEVVFYRPE